MYKSLLTIKPVRQAKTQTSQPGYTPSLMHWYSLARAFAALIDNIWASTQKTYFLWLANNKCVDQPVRPRSLVSACVICFLESIISKLATSEMSIF